MDLNPISHRLPRVPFTRPVVVHFGNGQGPHQKMWAANLSIGGMFIRTQEPLTPGMRVSIGLDGDAGVLPPAEAEVVWQRVKTPDNPEHPLFGFGVRFVSLAPNTRALVDTLVKHGGTATVFKELETVDERTPSVETPVDLFPQKR